MCKFYTGFYGVWGDFRPAELEIALRLRYKKIHQPVGNIKTTT